VRHGIPERLLPGGRLPRELVPLGGLVRGLRGGGPSALVLPAQVRERRRLPAGIQVPLRPRHPGRGLLRGSAASLTRVPLPRAPPRLPRPCRGRRPRRRGGRCRAAAAAAPPPPPPLPPPLPLPLPLPRRCRAAAAAPLLLPRHCRCRCRRRCGCRCRAAAAAA